MVNENPVFNETAKYNLNNTVKLQEKTALMS
jgi:hypothetical protein